MTAPDHAARWKAKAPAPEPRQRGLAEWVARLRGFEPPTPSSGGWCSDPLSYRRVLLDSTGTTALALESGSGRGEWIRTTDPLLPKQMRYQAALRPVRLSGDPVLPVAI